MTKARGDATDKALVAKLLAKRGRDRETARIRMRRLRERRKRKEDGQAAGD